MALPNVDGETIAVGYNCHVRIGTNASDAEIVAFVTSYNATQDFQVQDAVVLGNLGPISIDPQGYNCSITLGTFIPAKGLLAGAQQYADGGKVSLMDIMPNRAKFMEDGAVTKFAYMDFYNKKIGKVLDSFQGVIISNEGKSVEGNAYVRGNVQMRALAKL
ncbi:hypothetical protein FACS189447_03360 [Spirochaetia bacterium]|nr:hypothetical protein FACS189447_03360 [Spirochaetia bacterium]